MKAVSSMGIQGQEYCQQLYFYVLHCWKAII